MANLDAFIPVAIGPLRLSLGEAPVWDAITGCLYRVDIERHMVHRIDPETGGSTQQKVPRLPSVIGLCRSGQLLLASCEGMIFLDFESGETSSLCNPISHQPLARLNDGKVAPDGSFWVGSMQNNIADDGQPVPVGTSIGGFFRVTADGGISTLVPEVLGISNTLAWSPSGQFFYFADSLSGNLIRARARA